MKTDPIEKLWEEDQEDLRWAPDSGSIQFVRMFRGYQKTVLYVADAATGEARSVLEETSRTFLDMPEHEDPHLGRALQDWRVLSGGQEVIWWSDNYGSQANHTLAGNLRGHLLLMYGTLDDNVHPNATLLLINELIQHNKDFDVLPLPNRNHGFGDEPYVIRRTWDYFVRYLLGQEPPAEYKIEEPP